MSDIQRGHDTTLPPDMVSKVLWRLEEAINKRMNFPNLDWLVVFTVFGWKCS